MYNVQCTVHLYLVLWALTAGHASNCAKNAVERKWCWWLRSQWCCQTRPWHWAPALVLWSLYIILTVVPTPTVIYSTSVINNSQWYLTSHLNLVSNINEPHLISAPSLLSRNGEARNVLLFITDDWRSYSRNVPHWQLTDCLWTRSEAWPVHLCLDGNLGEMRPITSPHLTSPLSSDQQWVRRLTNIESPLSLIARVQFVRGYFILTGGLIIGI